MRLKLIILLFFYSGIILGQSRRLVPEIDSVTVTNQSQVQISWSFDGNDNYALSSFFIYRAFGSEETDFVIIKEVNANTYSIIDIYPFPHNLPIEPTNDYAVPNKKSERYKIAAYSATLDSLSPTSDMHQTIFLASLFDSCEQSIYLHWNLYKNWKDGISHYNLYSKTSESTYILHKDNITDTSLTITNILENQNYSFYIQALGNNGESSTSNIVNEYTQKPVNPTFIDFNQITIDNNNHLSLNFNIDIQADVLTYNLYHSENRNSNYSLIETSSTPFNNQNINYTSNIIDIEKLNYFYLQAENTCHEYILNSDTLNNLLFQIDTIIGNKNIFVWNNIHPYNNYHSRIYKTNEYNTFELIETISEKRFTDIIDITESNFNQTSTYCYYIENFDPNNASQPTNRSNTMCFEKESSVEFPNLCTPNNDGVNDSFKPQYISIMDKNYHFLIVNRWGTKIFETNKIDDAWNGKINNTGNLVPEGTYIYYLKYQTIQGKIKNKSGSVSVYYPNTK